jgi:DNA polymerase III sliding clamp (beta) subunit (PCNA family)
MKKYPDISKVIKKKEKHRRSLAALSFEEKIEMVFKLQERRKFIKSGQVVSDSQKAKAKST